MYEGYIFVWLSWISWGITTFFLPKTKVRTSFSIWILLTLITSTTVIVFQNYLMITLAFLIVLTGGIILFSLQKRWLFKMVKILIIAFTYSALLFMMRVSPVVSFLPESMMLILPQTLIIIFLTLQFQAQLTITIIGNCLGELIYSIVLNQLHTFYIIGDYSFLIRLQSVILLLTMTKLCIRWRQNILQKSISQLNRRSMMKKGSVRL